MDVVILPSLSAFLLDLSFSSSASLALTLSSLSLFSLHASSFPWLLIVNCY